MQPKTFVLLSTAILLATTGCKSGDKQLPNTVSIVISPTKFTWQTDIPEDASCTNDFSYPNHQDEVLTVRVSDGENRALVDTEVLFSLNLTHNSRAPSGREKVVELYSDMNGDMRPQPEELVSGVDDALFTAHTDKYNGHIQLIVRMNLSCTYTTTLDAFVGGYSGSASFEVLGVPPETPDEDVDPAEAAPTGAEVESLLSGGIAAGSATHAHD